MKKIFSLLILVMFACDSNTITSPSGVKINLLKKGDSKGLEYGKILILDVSYSNENGYILSKSSENNPLAMMYDSTSATESGLLKEVFDQLSIGDSVYFKIPAQNLWEVSFRSRVPDSIGKGSSIAFNLEIEAQLNREEYSAYMQSLELKRNAPLFEEEEKKLDEYLSKNNIETNTTASGLKYFIIKDSENDRAIAGDIVTVKYRGTTLDGDEFDSGEYTFTIGNEEVITAWDEGITLLGLDSKAVLYVPSKLAYGSRGAGIMIPPFSSLVFEVELLEIK